MYLYTFTLPLLMVSAVTFANRFWGGLTTVYPKAVYPDGSYKVEIRFKQTFDSCDFLNWTGCSQDCGTLVSQEEGVIYDTGGRNTVDFNWCQTERVVIRQYPNNFPFWLRDRGCCWPNLTNNFMNWDLYTDVNLGNRSDLNKANRPPVYTSISFVRVPQNCPRTIELMMFDPDKDPVICSDISRRALGFTLNQTRMKDKDFCTVSFISSTVGVYGVELIVYDISKENINISFRNASDIFNYVWNQGYHFSFLPLQFAVKVDPAVASCVEGVYLPKFLPPTPENGDQFKAVINQELRIIIKATASVAGVRGIIISGPLNTTVEKFQSSSDEFALRWTPRSEDLGEYFPICFIAESNQVNNTYYQSDMRCVIVEVGPYSEIVVGLRLKVRSKTQLTKQEIEDTLLKQFQEELIRNGLPNTTTLSLRSVQQVNP